MENEHFEFEGVNYEITVRSDGGWFKATWKCPLCGESRTVRAGTRGEAVGRAKVEVAANHHPVHRAPEAE
jgi:hypothetical protein